MKLEWIAAVAAVALAGAAQADSHNPAVKSSSVVATPVAARGRNSFTEAQARGRIEKAGYTNVGKLVKNANGVWQGPASKAGHNVQVGLDYKGDVVTR